MGSPQGDRTRRDSDHEQQSVLGQWYERFKNVLIRVLLLIAVGISLVGQFVPAVGDFLIDNVQFGATALLLTVSFFFLDTIADLDSAAKTKASAEDSIIVHQTKDLHPYLENAFRARNVSVDFAGFTGETLADLLSDCLNKIESGEFQPKRLVIRVLVPDPRKPMVLPCNVEGAEDNPAYRDYIFRNTKEATEELIHRIQELKRRYPDREYTAEVRMHNFVQLFKMLTINESIVFQGLYSIEVRSLLNSQGDGDVYDLRGVKMRMFGAHAEQGRESDRHQVYAANEWFATVWGAPGLTTQYART